MYLRSIFGLSITIVYVSLQERQKIHKTTFTMILLSYSAAYGLCIKVVIKANNTCLKAGLKIKSGGANLGASLNSGGHGPPVEMPLAFSSAYR